MLPGVEIGLGLLKLQAGDQTEGLRHLEAAATRNRELGRPATLSGTMSFIAYAHEILGDLDAMAVALREAHDLVDSLGDQASVAYTAARLARARALLGDTDEATQLLNVAEAAAPETDVDETERLRARAALAAQEGKAAVAFEHALASVARAEQTDMPNLLGASLEDLASIAPAQERRRILERALRAYERKGNAIACARLRGTLSRSP